MTVNTKTAFQIGTESLGKMIHPRKHSEMVEGQIVDKQAFHKEFIASLQKSHALLGVSAPQSFTDLLESVSFEDPISSDSTFSTEEFLLDCAQKIFEDAKDGSVPPEELISKTMNLVEVRKQECLQGK